MNRLLSLTLGFALATSTAIVGAAAAGRALAPAVVMSIDVGAASIPSATEKAALAEAARWIGARNPAGTVGPWCADFVSFVLARVGRPPLAGRTAASALDYGPRLAGPRVGALAVMRARRGPAAHVGFVEGIEPDGSIRLLSGNWRGRVALSVIARASVVAFVDPAMEATPRGAGELVHPRAGASAKAKVARFRRAVKRPSNQLREAS
jgi:uncharacterized protein (TIGR02594 family)